jgi:hypothetical protein
MKNPAYEQIQARKVKARQRMLHALGWCLREPIAEDAHSMKTVNPRSPSS